MTITAFGSSAYGLWRASESFGDIRADLATLESQLSTGKVGSTYAGLGSGAATSMTLRSKLATLDSYATNIQDGTLRINAVTSGLQTVSELARSLTTSLSGTVGQIPVGATSAAISAQHGLSLIIDVLNTEIGDRFLFSGRATDTRPVASFDLLLEGDMTHAGLKTLIAERKAADLGAAGHTGRVTVAATGATVTFAEDNNGLMPAAAQPFGIKIAAATATGAGLTPSYAAGPPSASAGISVASLPAAGDSITFTLTLPDSSQKTVTLVAGLTAGAGETAFAIGATPADTATNIAAALRTAITSVASTELPAASAIAVSRGFFSASGTPMRVVGSPPESAVSLTAGTAQNTVLWYAGDNSATPRNTSPLRVSDERTVGLGLQANEAAFRTVLTNYAVLAAEDFPAGDASAQARYGALRERILAQVDPPTGAQTITDITSDFAVAAGAVKGAGTTLTVTRTQVRETLSEVEDADPTETATKLLATQTRLSAAYQTTAALQKLSLVNYL